MKQLSVLEFGEELLQTCDLDPVYVMLEHSDFSLTQKSQFCVAYWLFYHTGVASLVSSYTGKAFWKELLGGLTTYCFPRGRERRHFRGEKAVQALESLKSRYPAPETFVEYLKSPEISQYRAQRAQSNGVSQGFIPLRFETVLKRSLEHQQFGPWISFKAADMLDRCLYTPVDFSNCKLLQFYKEPREGAEVVSKQLNLVNADTALQMILNHFKSHKAPPNYNRIVNVQEAETILCKYKSYLNGHYPVGTDSREIYHALDGWGESAKQLQSILVQKCDLTLRKTLV